MKAHALPDLLWLSFPAHSAVYAGATVVLILPTIPCAVIAGEEGAGGDENSEQQGDPNMDDALSGAVAVSTTVV